MSSRRLRRGARPLPLLLAVMSSLVLVAVACTNAERPSVQAQPVALPTPIRSAGVAVEAAVAELDAALEAVGERIAPEARPYRPSEPESLLQVPRAVLRVDLADPDDGFVVVYQFPDGVAARAGADAMAEYLGSGFGQTNYPVDAQFSVGLAGDAVIFTSWSRGRSDDPERAEAAFDAVATVGEEVEVRK